MLTNDVDVDSAMFVYKAFQRACEAENVGNDIKLAVAMFILYDMMKQGQCTSHDVSYSVDVLLATP